MLKTIGQLTLERDFLKDCFCKAGKPIPSVYQNRSPVGGTKTMRAAELNQIQGILHSHKADQGTVGRTREILIIGTLQCIYWHEEVGKVMTE